MSTPSNRENPSTKTYKCVAINEGLKKRHAFYASSLPRAKELARIHVQTNYWKTHGWVYESQEVFKQESYDTGM